MWDHRLMLYMSPNLSENLQVLTLKLSGASKDELEAAQNRLNKKYAEANAILDAVPQPDPNLEVRLAQLKAWKAVQENQGKDPGSIGR